MCARREKGKEEAFQKSSDGWRQVEGRPSLALYAVEIGEGERGERERRERGERGEREERERVGKGRKVLLHENVFCITSTAPNGWHPCWQKTRTEMQKPLL